MNDERAFRFPQSTALALACAALELSTRASIGRHRHKSDRLFRECLRHLDGLGGIAAVGHHADVQRAAIEVLRSNAAAREEALAALNVAYPREPARHCLIVHAFTDGATYIEPVDIMDPERRFA